MAPIKPIPRVITHVEDITTDKCRTTLKKDLKDWKADVVLHDGAPNVGSAWVQDAFTQSELVLSSLKLATEFLAKGGTFVTKVFRSKDYNSLMWVFQQLFKRVEATKPPSSRNVSAEIFVVCREYLAPKHIDPKFLDPKHVFKEVEGENNEETLYKASLNDLLFPEKAAKKRKRDGYEDGINTLRKSHSVQHFLKTPKESEAITILANCHLLTWDNSGLPTNMSPEELAENEEDPEFIKRVKSDPSTTEEIMEYLSDLKVLGRKDYKMLLKWRKTIRESLKLGPQKSTDEPPVATENEELPEEDDSDAELEKLQELAESLTATEKKNKRKKQEKLTKERRRMQLNMTTPADIGMEAEENFDEDAGPDENPGTRNSGLFNLREISKVAKLNEGTMDKDHELESSSDEFSPDEEGSQDEDISSDEERIEEMNNNVDEMYDDYMERQFAKDPKLRVKQIRDREKPFTGASDEESELGSASEEEPEQDLSEKNDSMSDDFKTESEDEAEIETVATSKKALQWFDQPVFKDLNLEVDEQSEEEEEEQNAKRVKNKKKDLKREQKSPEPEEMLSSEDEKPDLKAQKSATDQLTTAQAVDLAIKMVQDGGRYKRDILDDFGYNRYAFNDDEQAMPKWFMDDELKHTKPNRPITKEAVEILRQKQKALDARPIKKVMESKARKKQKALKRMERMRKKMNDLVDEGGQDGEDPELVGKLSQVQKMMKSAERKAKEMTRRRVQLVVARGGNRGKQGRPTGVKGRYKMVDGRMKKEVRALKRVDSKKRKSK